MAELQRLGIGLVLIALLLACDPMFDRTFGVSETRSGTIEVVFERCERLEWAALVSDVPPNGGRSPDEHVEWRIEASPPRRVDSLFVGSAPTGFGMTVPLKTPPHGRLAIDVKKTGSPIETVVFFEKDLDPDMVITDRGTVSRDRYRDSRCRPDG